MLAMETRFLDQLPEGEHRRSKSMKAIREAAGQDLQWSGKKVVLFGKEEFELRAGDEVLAMLHAREKRTDWTCGEAADGRWALKSRNIGSGEIVVITELDSQAEIAVVKRGRKQGIQHARNTGTEQLADVEDVLSAVEAPARLIETVAHAQ
jgi:hypothetical protein